jgi:hypothetical protein
MEEQYIQDVTLHHHSRLVARIYSSLSARAHQENWQLQRNRNFREMSPISSRQLVSRLADAH